MKLYMHHHYMHIMVICSIIFILIFIYYLIILWILILFFTLDFPGCRLWGVTCFRVIAISIAFVTPDQQIVSFPLSPLHFPKAVCMYYDMSMYYLIVILTVCFPIGQINNNNNNNNLTLNCSSLPLFNSLSLSLSIFPFPFLPFSLSFSLLSLLFAIQYDVRLVYVCYRK